MSQAIRRVPETERTEMEEARAIVREHLRRAAAELDSQGIPRPALDGKVLRPLAGYLIVPPHLRGKLDHRFWRGALAVEMVHEASLLHDDILDDAPERRGRPTLFAASGIGPALVLGDHLLTGAYRVAASAESPAFLDLFIRAVERTVAGEIAQEKAQGRILEEPNYLNIITGKSGELFRAVFALGPSLLGFSTPEESGALGARLGCIYQMVDDVLDYCPDAHRGKVPLQDYHQGKWTWPLGLLDFQGFHTPEEEVLSSLFRRAPGKRTSPLEDGSAGMVEMVQALLEDFSRAGLESGGIRPLLEGWATQVRETVSMEAERFSDVAHPSTIGWSTSEGDRLAEASKGLETMEGRIAYFGHHGTTFRFASRLFPKDALRSVSGVYAFCRFSDDLVDEAEGTSPQELAARLMAWEEMARAAYEGERTGVGLLDEVMGEMRSASVPFHYAGDLLDGIRMDLVPRDYASLEELREYSYRVASVVGGWLTELFGVHDSWVLERAHALGHAMQLTNILRDVGEDLERGRIYLPQDRMAKHGVDRELLEAMAKHGAPNFPGYHALLEDLISEAELEYDRAFPAIASLPSFFQGPVAVAAQAYRAIHGEIRRNGYDNLTRRARTSGPKKVRAGLLALIRLRRLPKERPPASTREPLGGIRRLAGPDGQEATA